MHLLIRKLSAYTGSDLLLGVFRTADDAQRARVRYLDEVVHGTSDPWAVQAYHAVSDDDLQILSSLVELDLPDAVGAVFVISSYAEAFGQVVRVFEALAGSDAAARSYAGTLETKADVELPYHCKVDEVVVGELSRSARGHLVES